MRVVFFGTPQFAVPSLERLLAHPEFDVVGVVTQPDRRRGRGSQLSPAPVKSIALKTGCPIWQPERLKRHPDTLAALAALDADAFVVVAYGQILSQTLLDLPRLGCVNAHGSLLPAYRGAAPIQWALYHGERETGVTTMKMDAGMDTGPMLEKARVPVGLWDNAGDLATTLARLSADLLVSTLLKLNEQLIRPVPQDTDRATYAPLIQKADYGLDWSRGAVALHNQVRGFYPNCTVPFRQSLLKVVETAPLENSVVPELPAEVRSLPQTDSHPPGTVAALLSEGPAIATGQGYLLLRQVKPAGKQAQSGKDFANGARLSVGEAL